MEVFFYGLFMDEVVLTRNGIALTNPQNGYVNNYALKIGKRASLVPCPGEKSYGIVMSVGKEALQQLYSKASVSGYLPEEVHVVIDTGRRIKAVCYNLPPELLAGTNHKYAVSLYKLAKQLGFPDDYLRRIEMFTTAGRGLTSDG